MKYIITENRLSGIINYYLKKNFDSLEKVVTKHEPECSWYYDGRKLIFVYNRELNQVYLDDSYLKIMQSMFSQLSEVRVTELIKDYLIENFNIDPLAKFEITSMGIIR